MKEEPKRHRPDGNAHYLITGFPGSVERRLAQTMARSEPECALSLLVSPKHARDGERWLKALESATAEVLVGDVEDMHLGLSGGEYRKLRDGVTDIFHLASPPSSGLPRSAARRVSLVGVRNILELARECRHFRRLNYLSSCYVSGEREGVIAEDELECGQGFRNTEEEAKYQGELLINHFDAKVPSTIYRPSSIVGDSRAGEIDKFDGPFYLGLSWLISPFSSTFPLPGQGVAPLNIVPADFVAEALWTLSRDSRAEGKTFHLVDPQPMSVRRVFEAAAERMGKPFPKFSFSARAADVMLRLPLIERWARPQRAAIGYLNHLAFYNCRNTLALLEGVGSQCPPLTSYLDRLLEFFRGSVGSEHLSPVEDPLDPSPPSAI